MRRLSLIAVLAAAGCGGGGLEGTLAWERAPVVEGRALSGTVRNATSHTVDLDPARMRLLDDEGRKVGARIRVSKTELETDETARVDATWRTGRPVRLDYGSGALALPSE